MSHKVVKLNAKRNHLKYGKKLKKGKKVQAQTDTSQIISIVPIMYKHCMRKS